MNIEILKAMKAILSSEDKWTQRTWARNSEGETVAPAGHMAAKWSLCGAAFRAAHQLGYSVDAAAKVLADMEPELGKEAMHWNDTKKRKFSEVKLLLTDLIHKEELAA